MKFAAMGFASSMPKCRQVRQQGFALLELSIAAALTAMVVVWGAGKLAQGIEDNAAQVTGSWLFEVKRAMDQVLAKHFDSLSEGRVPTDAAGNRLFGNALRPTLQELRAQGHLAAGFPDRAPSGSPVSIRILPATTCPGVTCRIDAIAYVAPLRVSGTVAPDLMRLAIAVSAGQGYAGFVPAGPSSRIRGSSFEFSNPLVLGERALPAGTLVVWSGLDQSTSQQFVRMRDSRNPDLRGALSIARRLTAGEYLQLNGQAAPGDTCAGKGLFARDARGALLSCQSGFWASAGGTRTVDGPICPAGSAPVAYYVDQGSGNPSLFAWQGHNFVERCSGLGGDAGFICSPQMVNAAKVKCLD